MGFEVVKVTQDKVVIKLSKAWMWSTTDVTNTNAIKVTIWQPGLFKNELWRPGISISVPLSHQVDPGDAHTLFFYVFGSLLTWLIGLSVTTWALTALFLRQQSLLIWHYLEWLVLVAHLTVLNGLFPGYLCVFFKPFLSLIRLDVAPEADTSQLMANAELANLIYAGYSMGSFSANLVFVPLLLAAVALYAILQAG